MKRDLITIAAEIRETFRADVDFVVKRGNLLLEAKRQLNQHGAWLPWLDQNFSMDARTAQRSMTIAKFAAKYDTKSYLNLSLAALTHLAIGVYPAKVVKAVMAEAKKRPVSEKRLQDIARSSAPTPKEIKAQADTEERQEQEAAEVGDILDGPPPDLAPVEPGKAGPRQVHLPAASDADRSIQNSGDQNSIVSPILRSRCTISIW